MKQHGSFFVSYLYAEIFHSTNQVIVCREDEISISYLSAKNT